MGAKCAAWVLVALVLGAGWLQAAPPPTAADDLPATLERVTGSKAFSYTFFGLLAAVAVLLIYRGVRAR